MHSGADAEQKFVELSKSDCYYQRTRIFIALNPPANNRWKGDLQHTTGKGRKEQKELVPTPNSASRAIARIGNMLENWKHFDLRQVELTLLDIVSEQQQT
jgi:hypothetical protein